MASTLSRPADNEADDDADDRLEPQRTLDELAAEFTGEPPAPISEEAEDAARLSQAELEAAAGVQPPPGQID
ncbi:hypothetical protein KBY82_13295 [Cyanobium sp. AMD-g]|uniref:hypothetical protein n=1 Tax=Cyanobium sp. AMD-g TaxID=2823699 RepID=UPI0020CE5107|nr:hypothetical protein [Cyanobium sp. AMD-g]MCP9931756.1 hypothetical protein [Cyanobium sp. AMD-g]